MNLPGAANVVRVIAGEPTELSGSSDDLCQDKGLEDGFTVQGCTLLETNIDHLTPEALAFICEELLKEGAFDVWQEPIVMKKGRLAVCLCVLCAATAAQTMSQSISAATGSLGVRSRYVERTIAPRKKVVLETSFGPVPFKVADISSPSESVSWLRPEYEAVAALAREHNLEFVELYDRLVREQGRSFRDAPDSL